MAEEIGQPEERAQLLSELKETVGALTCGPLSEIEFPESLRDNLALFQRLERRVLKEYDPQICELFDVLLRASVNGVEGLCQEVLAELDAFSGSALDDDIALVALRFDEIG